MIAIHIGSPKAGSTTIQRFLNDNADLLRQIGVDYPSIGRPNRGYHANLYYELRGHKKFKEKYGAKSDLAAHIISSRLGSTIISSEELHNCTLKETSPLRGKLYDLDEDIRVILVIRDLADVMPSIYSQSTKGGENVHDFDSFFLARVSRRGNGFMQVAQVWGEAFGWDRLRVRVLDRKFLLNGDLIDDFLTQVGIDPSGSHFMRPETTSVANASPGWRVLGAVRALNCGSHGLPASQPLSKSLPHDQNVRKLLGRVARKIGEERGWNAERDRYLSLSQAQQCVPVHREAISALNEVLPQALPPPQDLATRGFVEREFMPQASQIPAQELREFYDEVALRVSRKRPAALFA